MSSPVSWRRYNIFISSTFKDMDFERDVIKFRVIPALNRRFRDRRVELQAIDLRLGVNTSDMSEEESERKVLSVCTSCIDSARPFFIGLLGKRYGWIPPVERWKEFIGRLAPEEQEILANTAGCSVTEMEIVYGALSQGSFDSSHVLFYLRDDASYNGLPENLLPTFCDSDPDNLKRLDALKAKVMALFGERGGQDDRCTPYHLEWADGHFSSEEFERIVTEQLAHQIETETAREEEVGADTWWAQEKELEESTLLRLLPGSIELDLGVDADGLEEDDEETFEKYQEADSDYIVWFAPGFGASTHMAQEYSQWDGDDEVVRLLAVFGLSEYSTSMRPVLARWIHELAVVCGVEDLPDDDQLLGRMPVPDLNELLASLVDKAREMGKYIYIYMDDVEALEMTAAKDLYMPWLDRIADQVNVFVNLEDGSEAREKFLQAHPGLARKMVPVVQDAEEAEGFISQYEKNFFLELPAEIRRDMIDSANSEDGVFIPLRVHSVFRIFESLTQEDFAQIRSREGNQIDAINGYLKDIWAEMPDTPYDIMTFMVNQIVKNLGIGEGLRQAIWTIAAAPFGLREKDISHFAGDDWDDVQFYRTMNFLHDFFYEDRTRHTWRAKYITRFEDGLQDRQKQISEYILTLDKKDSLRETMGLYYAIAGGEPSHFASYMVEGDYLHGQQMSYLTSTHGPQMRQLSREGFFEGEDFERYALALEPSQRLQLSMNIMTALADLQDERLAAARRMAGFFDDVDPDTLSAPDAFAYASILAGKSDSEPHLLKSLQAAKRCMDLGFGTARQLVSMAGSLLQIIYSNNGEEEKLEALQKELQSIQTQSASERLTALYPLIGQAAKDPSLLDGFFDKYYDIVDSLELDNDTFTARFKSAKLMIFAYNILLAAGRPERLLEELMRFMPSMKLFYKAGNFFSSPEPLELFIQYHLAFVSATQRIAGEYQFLKENDTPLEKIGNFAFLATNEGALRLKEVDPESKFITELRGFFAGNTKEDVDLMREILEVEDVDPKGLDALIEEQYDEYLKTL